MDEIIVKELKSNFSTVYTSSYLKIRDSYLLEMHGKYDSLREEICKCITFGIYQASITLTNHLLELFFKDVLMFYYCGIEQISDSQDFEKFGEAVEKFDNYNLVKTLAGAKEIGVISEIEWQQLDSFRKHFRNAYSHAEKKKIFGVDKINIASGKINGSEPLKSEIVAASSLFIMHDYIQKQKASNQAIPYFLYVDKIICREEIKRHPSILERPEIYKRKFNF